MKEINTNITEKDIFTEQILSKVLKVFFDSLLKFQSMQEKLNEGCKGILNGKKISKAMLQLNDRMHMVMQVIKNCLAYINTYSVHTNFSKNQ